jgi:hypothetical protein
MEAMIMAGEETPEQAAEAISAALDFLEREAKAAGLPEVGELIREASIKAKERSKAMSSESPT